MAAFYVWLPLRSGHWRRARPMSPFDPKETLATSLMGASDLRPQSKKMSLPHRYDRLNGCGYMAQRPFSPHAVDGIVRQGCCAEKIYQLPKSHVTGVVHQGRPRAMAHPFIQPSLRHRPAPPRQLGADTAVYCIGVEMVCFVCVWHCLRSNSTRRA